MRIRSIELAWFRGAAGAVTLEPNCKSMVVYGENGSGKSSFVDAVDYVLNNGSVEHLRTEYSGSRQVNAIPNTHKPANAKTTLRFKFQDGSHLKIDFNPNGSSKKLGGEAIAMGEWEYRQTVLRQDEVAKFIHDTKGEKYSALLPLFGLHKLEVAAENLRKLKRTVENEAKLGEKKATSNNQITCARLPSQIRATNNFWKRFTDYTHDIAVETEVTLTRFYFVAKRRLPLTIGSVSSRPMIGGMLRSKKWLNPI